MAALQHLKNAPIKEALIDIRVTTSPDTTIDILESISDQIPGDYPKKELRHQVLTEINFKSDEKPDLKEIEQGPQGYWCKSANELNIAQIRFDGFTFSELKPYTNWSEFSEKARQIWELYCAGVNCESVTRVAVRYINHLEIQYQEGEDFSKYLSIPPDVPESLPQSLRDFVNRVTIVFPDEAVFAHVTQALAPPEDPKNLNIILDIDVYRDLIDNVDNSAEFTWDIVSTLRDVKNKIFFNYITDETLEFFK